MVAGGLILWMLVGATSLLLFSHCFTSHCAVAEEGIEMRMSKVSQRLMRTKERYSLPSIMQPSETLKYQNQCWHLNFSPPTKTIIDHTPLPFLIGSPSCRGHIFLLVMVHSAVNNYKRRELIRHTWASIANIHGDRLSTIFFVGQSTNANVNAALRNESDSRADIVQGDFVDTYRNLTYKHLYALRWIGERCQSVEFVMKVDDDVVLNLFQLRVVLKEQEQLTSTYRDFIFGQVDANPKPIRVEKSKWSVTKEEWPEDTYPEYCKGFGYVMTGSLIPRLYHCAKWRRYFWIDDVFITGALARALGAPRIQWEDGWGVKFTHPRLIGAEAGHMVIVNAARNSVMPTLHKRIWRAIMRHSGSFDEDF